MQQTDPISTAAGEQTAHDAEAARRRSVTMRRVRLGALAVLGLTALALLPPLVNVNRYQRRITTSISGSIGRPVHLDNVSLTLLPLPGFEIQNLVVDEDPAFGEEPIIRANTVRATLRLSSLWRRRVEFSSISFTEPSLNLVHTPDGRWNIESILLQASHIETAPTGQRRAGPAPRFPYIEATNARINFKQNNEKKPFSLTSSDFALWAPDPNQWQLRLKANPSRTDSNSSDTGVMEMEGTLGRGDSLQHIPINLEGTWRDAPLGEASRVLTGSDAGWRGTMALSANLRGTVGENAVTARLRLNAARRADFVPQQPLSAQVECFATATAIFHSFEDLRCSWPPSATADGPSLALIGTIPDVWNLSEAHVQLGSSGVPAATVLNWLRILNAKVSESLTAKGKLTGSLTYDPKAAQRWTGQVSVQQATLTRGEGDSLVTGDITLHAVASAAPQDGLRLVLDPVQLPLGGHEPAILTGAFDATGYTLQLNGQATEARLREFAAAAVPLSSGLVEAPVTPDGAATSAVTATPALSTTATHIDRTTTAAWSQPQPWVEVAAKQPQAAAKHKNR